jgi:hypothetical protein
MDRKFNYTVDVLSRLVWKCDMCNEEIHDMLNIMNKWLTSNVVGESYQWYTPPYSKGEVSIEHNGEKFLPCVCFEHKEGSEAFRARFGCIR